MENIKNGWRRMSGACRTDGDDHRRAADFALCAPAEAGASARRAGGHQIQHQRRGEQQGKIPVNSGQQYYQAEANNLKAQLAAIKEDIAAQQQSIELKNAGVAEKATMWRIIKACSNPRLKGMYEMSRQSNLAILLGIDDVSQMLLFAENLQQISEHDTQLIFVASAAGQSGLSPARRAGAAACGPCRPRAGADRHRRGVFQCHPAGGCGHQRG